MATKDKIVIFVAHAIDDDVSATVQKIKDICSDIYREGLLPVAPYVVALLADNKGLGIELSLLSLELELKLDDGSRRRFVNQVWLYGDRISEIMGAIVKFALGRNIPVYAKSEGTKRRLEILLAQKENDSPPV